jgi:hypothetical protein
LHKKKPRQSLWALNLEQIRAGWLEQTRGAFQDRFGISPSFLPSGKAGGLQILRYQGFAVDDYGITLVALALKPSDFCNVGVYVSRKKQSQSSA